MKRRQFAQACMSGALVPLSVSLVACGGGGSEPSPSATPVAGAVPPAAQLLPNERIVLSSTGAAFILNKDDKTLRPGEGTPSSAFPVLGVQRASEPSSNPVDAAFDEAGKAYVLDRALGEIRVYGPNGQWLNTLGSYGHAAGQLAHPLALTVFGGKIFVADSANHRVAVFALDGTPLFQFGELGTNGENFNYPRDIEVSSNGQIFVLQSGKSRVTVFDASGRLLRTHELSRNSQGRRQQVNGIALDPVGDLVYTEGTKGTVCTLTAQGQMKSQLGGLTQFGKPVSARHVAQGQNPQPVLSGFVNLA